MPPHNRRSLSGYGLGLAADHGSHRDAYVLLWTREFPFTGIPILSRFLCPTWPCRLPLMIWKSLNAWRFLVCLCLAIAGVLVEAMKIVCSHVIERAILSLSMTRKIQKARMDYVCVHVIILRKYILRQPRSTGFLRGTHQQIIDGEAFWKFPHFSFRFSLIFSF